MSFGLYNDLEDFMSFMNGIFKYFTYLFVIMFIDSILIYPKIKKQHACYLYIILGNMK